MTHSIPSNTHGYSIPSESVRMAPPKSFTLQSQNIFLIYPQCSLTKESCQEQLLALFPERPPKYIRVASVLHEDGQPHLHVLLQFPYRFQTQNRRFFDLASPTRSTHFHPSVQSLQGARESSSINNYMSKHGECIEWGTFQNDRRSSSSTKLQEVYAAAFASNDKEIALGLIRQGDPRGFILNYSRINSKLDRIFKRPPEPYVSDFTNFSNVPADLIDWARDNIREPAHRPHRPISLILEGPSRTGKTYWARHLGPHNYHHGLIDLADHNDDAFYNLIDNIPPKSLLKKHWKEFIGAKRDWISKCKYAKPRQVPGGIPTIILCNPGPGSSYKEFLESSANSALKAWTLKNAVFFSIEDPLFSKEPSELECVKS